MGRIQKPFHFFQGLHDQDLTPSVLPLISYGESVALKHLLCRKAIYGEGGLVKKIISLIFTV